MKVFRRWFEENEKNNLNNHGLEHVDKNEISTGDIAELSVDVYLHDVYIVVTALDSESIACSGEVCWL